MQSKLIGKTIDNYRILALLGRGGMGIVYKALDIQLEKVVALKMIDLGLSRDENLLMQFRSEARALGRLQNPNIVSVYALRETELGLLMVMEFIEGETLLNLIKNWGPLSYAQALPIFRQIAHAVGHAHRNGIIHRDLKPANIMISRRSGVKVLDFGMAKIQQSMETTATLIAGGTLHYMSPEQIQGRSTDRRSDLYSLGMSLYEALAGETPFNAHESDFEIRKRIVEGKLVGLRCAQPAIPARLSKIVMQALSNNPDKRFQTAEAFVEALTAFEKKGASQLLTSAATLRIKKLRGWKIGGVLLTMIIASIAAVLLRRP